MRPTKRQPLPNDLLPIPLHDAAAAAAHGIDCLVPVAVDESTAQAEAFGGRSMISAEQLAERAAKLGFHKIAVGAVHALPVAGERFQRWLALGYQGTMGYLNSPRLGPRQLLPGARTVISAAMSYGAQRTQRDDHVASYAQGQDYHGLLKTRLRALAQSVCDDLGEPLRARVCVDSAPLLERGVAEALGLGFIGKSTMLIVPGVGSSVLLGELLLDVALPHSPRQPVSGCGSCNACLKACPTSAFVDEYTLDAQRCISYLTIEHQGWIPLALRSLIGGHLFGCDICQRVCPYNWSAKLPASELALAARPQLEFIDPRAVLTMGSSEYRRLVKDSALRRASRPQLQRNAAVVLGNSGDAGAVTALVAALETSNYPIVRGHAAWALGQLGGQQSLQALQAALTTEADSEVRLEIDAAVGGPAHPD